MQKIWVARSILDNHHFKTIQQCVDTVTVPPVIGRLPLKIQSGFSAFSADQWKYWTLYYSTMVLFDVLDRADLECWCHFVLGCRILCHHTLTKTQLQLGDSLLLRFCKKVQQLYGNDEITIYMHLHAHIKSCIEDYGPLHGFWVYAFERYNGILESFSNNRCIEAQLMERFLGDNAILSARLPTEYSDSFEPHLSSIRTDNSSGPRRLVGSLADTVLFTGADTSSQSWKYDSKFMSLPHCRSKYVLSSCQQQLLGELYAKLYGVHSSDISVCWKYTSITIHRKVLGSHNSRSRSSSIVTSLWRNDLFSHPLLKT